jgi:hypothetical protein
MGLIKMQHHQRILMLPGKLLSITLIRRHKSTGHHRKYPVTQRLHANDKTIGEHHYPSVVISTNGRNLSWPTRQPESEKIFALLAMKARL